MGGKKLGFGESEQTTARKRTHQEGAFSLPDVRHVLDGVDRSVQALLPQDWFQRHPPERACLGQYCPEMVIFLPKSSVSGRMMLVLPLKLFASSKLRYKHLYTDLLLRASFKGAEEGRLA
jgi:hypothetical protein